MATPPFHYQHMFPLGPDKTEYYLLTKDYVSKTILTKDERANLDISLSHIKAQK